MKIFAVSKAFFLFLSLLLLTGCARENLQPGFDASDKQNSILVSAAETDAAEPGIAVAPDGGFFVVWTEHGAGKTANVFVRKFDAEGKAVGDKTRVNPNQDEATAWRGDPPTIKVASGGAVYVGWTKRVKTENASGTDLFVSVSRDGGKSFQTAKVNDDSAPASHGMHSFDVDKNGKIFVAWLDERNIKKPSHANNEFSPDFEFVKVQHAQTPRPKPAEEEAEPNSETFFAVSNDGGEIVFRQ